MKLCNLITGVIASLATILLIAFGSPAYALTTFYSDFGPGETYTNYIGWGVFGSSCCSFSASSAMAFSPSVSGSVSQIDVALGNLNGTNSAAVSLWTYDSGYLGVQISPSWVVSSQPIFGSTNNTLTSIAGITGITLSDTSTYFLYITPGAASTEDSWNLNSTGQTGTMVSIINGVATSSAETLSAFDVLGAPSATPLPAALPLFATSLGALGLLGWRRKRRTQAGA